MALLKLPFKLGRPSNDTPVTSTDAVDDDTLQKKQSELNALFNQGKGLDNKGNEVQVGKSYSAGTGIDISQQDEISVKSATSMEVGGIKLAVATTIQNVVYNDIPVVGGSNGTAKVSIPTGTDSMAGLMSAEDHQRLNTHGFTVDFGSKETSVTYMNMDGACTLLRVATRNVASVTLSVVNGGTVTPALVSGAADISLALPADTGVVIDITRTSAGDAAVGVKYELS